MENEELEIQSQPVPDEEPKLLSSERVNEIVQREKAQAAAKAKREAEAQFEAERQVLRNQQPKSVGGIQAPDMDAIVQQVQDRFLEKLQEQQEQHESQEHANEMKKVAQTYFQKMEGGKEQYDDFHDVLADFNPQAFPQVVFLAAHVDNTPAVMYELAKNPAKLASIQAIAERDPKMAQSMVNKLSMSIKENQQVQAENVQTNSPLSRTKPSNVGADNGNMTLKDFKKASWLRG